MSKRKKGWIAFGIGMALFVLFEALIMPGASTAIQAKSGGVGPLDLVLTYTPEKAYEMMNAYGEAGRELYLRVELSADILFPLSYTLLFVSWMYLTFGASRLYRQLRVLAFWPIVFDYCENVGIITMLVSYPTEKLTVAMLGSICSSLKWAGFAVVMLLLLGGSAVRLVQLLRARKSADIGK